MGECVGAVYSGACERNELGQPIGEALPDWSAALAPPHTALDGRFCRLVPLNPSMHSRDLFEAFALDQEGRNWTYLPHGPFLEFSIFEKWMAAICRQGDMQFYAIVDRQTDRAVGIASYLRIKPKAGSIEVGHLVFSPLLQRRSAATEAMYLMMRRAFIELGYRRYEWKCDVLNEASRKAATRLGFRFEGLFRQANVYKGRDRDTAWFSILDREWRALEPAYEEWLADVESSPEGQQKEPLNKIIKRHVAALGS
ncbi:MAG: GNAT family protein [Parvibaculaceae bacterium]|nr:GNAT family protein [Parvibaculaceae bacterium]HBM87166.1 GNAT family N-acetyltransferase [Rhodobiaceae bacterium]